MVKEKKSWIFSSFLWQIISTCQVTVVFALQISTLKTWQNDVTRFARNNDSSNPYLLLSKKNRHPCGCLFSLGRGIRIRTLNDGVSTAQCFIQNANFKHVSRLSYLSNVSVNFFKSFTSKYLILLLRITVQIVYV